MGTEGRSFSERLLAWWNDHGRHDLPWQHPRTPYRVWVSEIMLQQTQVTTVIPYFERWMVSFPNLASLAEADLDDVLGHWSGLGYYARARNLHKTAQICRAAHGGELPQDPAELAALPGIGESTANAIVSQAHDIPLPILDGNAKRVLARHAAVEGWPGKSAVARTLWSEAHARLPNSRGADYTQAIMDLGATLCRRRNPACLACPVQTDCQGRRQGLIDQLPGKKPRTKVREMALRLAVHGDGHGAVLLERRPPSGIWGGLWCLPEAGDADGAELKPFEHRLTHRLLTIQPIWIKGSSLINGVECSNDQRFVTPSEWDALGLPGPIRQFLDQLHQQGQL